MQYLTVSESVRRLRAAGLKVQPGTVKEWIRTRRFQDTWILGRHTFIYEAELNALIDSQKT